jgi:hypothetical protein
VVHPSTGQLTPRKRSRRRVTLLAPLAHCPVTQKTPLPRESRQTKVSSRLVSTHPRPSSHSPLAVAGQTQNQNPAPQPLRSAQQPANDGCASRVVVPPAQPNHKTPPTSSPPPTGHQSPPSSRSQFPTRLLRCLRFAAGRRAVLPRRSGLRLRRWCRS